MQPKVVIIGVVGVVFILIAYLVLSGGDDKPTESNANISTGTVTNAATQAAAIATRAGGAIATIPAATTPTVRTTPATSGTSTTATSAGDFSATNRAHQALRSYRTTVDFVTAAGAPPLRITIEVQNPDRYHAVFPTLTPGAGAANIEVIGIGAVTYVKLGSTWTQSPASSVPFQAGQFLGPVAGFLQSTNAVRGGTTTVGGTTCTLWTVTSATNQKADACIGNDNLVRQIKYVDNASTVTLNFDMFNANFNIVAP